MTWLIWTGWNWENTQSESRIRKSLWNMDE
jgi:hypothetical protein